MIAHALLEEETLDTIFLHLFDDLADDFLAGD